MYLRARKRTCIIDSDNAISGWRISDTRGTARNVTCSGVQKRPYCTGRKYRVASVSAAQRRLYITRSFRLRDGSQARRDTSVGLDLIHFDPGTV